MSISDELDGGSASDGTTGAYLVVLEPDGDDAVGMLANTIGIHNVARSSEVAGAYGVEAGLHDADAVVFDALGVAVVNPDPDQTTALATATGEKQLRNVEPERWRYVRPNMADYVRGHRDAASAILDGLEAGNGQRNAAAASFADTPTVTWGLQAIGATTSVADGSGVQVAVLDTGVATTHPDLQSRIAAAQSFVAGQTVEDGHGHGTHCCGTIAGPVTPVSGRRYGVAPRALLYVGKVLGNDGRGADRSILAGIDWAVRSGCKVVSMSLGSDVATVSPTYETIGQRALRAGTLIVAAAGNNANRPHSDGFVGQPANAPSVLAVAALDPTLSIAYFSARSATPPGGQIDLAAPGVSVYSTAPGGGYQMMSGTSMATPHIAGLAALHAQRTGLTASELWGELVRTARRISPSSLDVGSGTGYAP
jgi:subtilisin family serine protease